MLFRLSFFALLLSTLALLPALHKGMASPSAGNTEKSGERKECPKETPPILLSADEIDYDQKTETVVATGNVEIVQEDRILRAHRITYNRNTGVMTATGNVCLKEPEKQLIALNPEASRNKAFLNHQNTVFSSLMANNILISNPLNLPTVDRQLPLAEVEEEEPNAPDYAVSFAPYAEFSHKFQDGFIQEAKMLMADNARLAAHSAKYIDGRKIIFRQAVYSPCNVCRRDPTKPPLWQLKADKVIHSKTDQVVIYHHARLEMGGVPVFYMPYFRHPDPTVKRKTGFLMPTYGSVSDLGVVVSTPFYYAIAPNRDLTLVPIVTTKQGPVLVGEYRHRFRDGDFSGSASYTRTHDLRKISKGSGLPRSDRWHIFTQGRFDLNDEHVATFDINRASDTTYLRRYPILPQGFRLKSPVKNMISTGALEQFRDHNYGVVRATAYQTDNPATTPYIVPHAWYTYQSDPGAWSQIWNFDANFLSLGRRLDTPGQNARHMQRLSLSGGWRLPYVSSNGHIWAFQMVVRGDSYALEHYQPAPAKPALPSAFRGRLFPTGSVQWRYPLIKRLDAASWVLEPTAMIVGSPRVTNSSIPNEDSLNIQVEDTSLFLPQRFSGLDRVDTGGRFIYGASSTWFFPRQKRVQFFLGHTLRLDRHQVLPKGAGEDKRASDIVTRFRFNPTDNVQLLNRMAWHYKRTRPRISDTSAIFGKKMLTFQLNHTFVNKNSTTNGVGISQATWTIGSQPLDRWSFAVGETRNLKRRQRSVLSHTVSALYHDECFRMTVSAFKTRSSDRDIRPNSGIMLQFDFKNLGSVSPLGALGMNARNVM